MSAEENKAIVHRFRELLNKGDAATIAAELLTPDFVLHLPGLPDVRGAEAWVQMAAGYFTAFPDLYETTDDEIAEGDRVANRVTWRGTHNGEMMGIPPTGKQVTVAGGMRIFRIADGKIAEEWGVDDMLGLLQQLGVIPTPGQAAG